MQRVVLPPGVPVLNNKCACCEHTETKQNVLENLFPDFVTNSRKCTSTFVICVSWSCPIVTRLALYCVRDLSLAS